MCVFSMGFLVACLRWCVESDGVSDLCVWVVVLCGHLFMSGVLLMCWG